jgi:hypothetical protein
MMGKDLCSSKNFEKPPISINSSTKWFELRTATDPLAL